MGDTSPLIKAKKTTTYTADGEEHVDWMDALFEATATALQGMGYSPENNREKALADAVNMVSHSLELRKLLDRIVGTQVTFGHLESPLECLDRRVGVEPETNTAPVFSLCWFYENSCEKTS